MFDADYLNKEFRSEEAGHAGENLLAGSAGTVEKEVVGDECGRVERSIRSNDISRRLLQVRHDRVYAA